MTALIGMILGYMIAIFLGKLREHVNFLTYFLVLVGVLVSIAIILYHLYTMDYPEGSFYSSL